MSMKIYTLILAILLSSNAFSFCNEPSEQCIMIDSETAKNMLLSMGHGSENSPDGTNYRTFEVKENLGSMKFIGANITVRSENETVLFFGSLDTHCYSEKDKCVVEFSINPESSHNSSIYFFYKEDESHKTNIYQLKHLTKRSTRTP